VRRLREDAHRHFRYDAQKTLGTDKDAQKILFGQR